MSGSAETLAAMDASANALYAAAPLLAGMGIWGFFGGSLAASKNAGDAGDFVAGGSPDWQANFVRLTTGVGWLTVPQGGVEAAQTYLVCARLASIGTGGAVASILGAASGNQLLSFQPVSGASQGLGMFSGGSPTTVLLAVNPITTFRLYAATSGGGVVTQIWDLTDALPVAAGTVAANPTPSAVGSMFGSSTAGPNNTVVDVAFGAKWRSVLSKAQIDVQAAMARSGLNNRGITGV